MKRKKLVLNKKTIAHLNDLQLGAARGGYLTEATCTDEISVCLNKCPLTDFSAQIYNCPRWITEENTCWCVTEEGYTCETECPYVTCQ